MRIEGTVGGRSADREDVLAWERRRIEAAADVLGLHRPTGRIEIQREQLLMRKLDLGRTEILRRLHRRLRLSTPSLAAGAIAARGRRRLSVCRLTASGGTADRFVAWFDGVAAENDQKALLGACPDHFAFGVDERGRQEVVETTGGSPLPTRFAIDYDDLESLTTAPDPAFTAQIAGVAVTAGTAVGGVRHQFRDGPDGLEAELVVEFPALVPRFMLREHSWHLACEFSNWITAAHRD